MADITIVGLGPGPAELRTAVAQQALDDATHIFVRGHGGVELDDLLHQPNVTDLSGYRDNAAKIKWHKAVDVVMASAKVGPIVLAVPGHPRFGEGLVRAVLAEAAKFGLMTQVIDGLSATDLLASALDIDPIQHRVQLVTGWELQSINAQAPFDGGLVQLSPRNPVLVTHVYSSEIMQAVANQLLRVFPADHDIVLISSAGRAAEVRESATIADLQQHPGGWLLAIYVPSQGDLAASRTPATLQHIVARLRREDGCPWDREQTHQSLAPSLVDEVYEVLDAIEAGDDANFAEELGDLLLLIMMQAQIAEERGAFQLEDVYHGISTKIVRRHPHVFGDAAAQNASDVLGLWQEIKKQEKADQPEKPEKAADGQPHSMPALERARRVLKKHPVEVSESCATDRQHALFTALADVIAAGEDPEQIIRQSLVEHVTARKSGEKSGEEHAFR